MSTHQEYIFPLSLHIQVVALPQNLPQNRGTENRAGTEKNVYLVFVFMHLVSSFGHHVLCLKAAARMREVNGLYALGAH